MEVNLSNGRILVAQPYSRALEYLIHNGFIWSKARKLLEAEATLSSLQALDHIGAITPELYKIKQRMEEELAALTAEKLNPDPVPCVPAPVKAKLYKHQIRAFNMALARFYHGGRGFGLLFEMGCGKSLTAIAIIGALYKQGAISRVLICCPSSITSVWAGEFQKFAAFRAVVGVMQGTKTKRLDVLKAINNASNDALHVAVVNYESTHREGILQALARFNADVIVCDESQRIKTHNAAQSKAVQALGDKARYKLILSGTPVQNSAIDIYSQYRFLDPQVFGRNFYAFKNRYAILGGYQQHQIVGYQRMDELIRKAHSIAYRVTKAECLDLPEQVFVKRMIELPPAERKTYDALAKTAVAELESGEVTASTILTKMIRLQQFTGGFLADDEGTKNQVSKAKLSALEDILDDYLPTGGKVVIFALFREELAHIRSLCASKGIAHVFIDGSVPLEDRGEVVKQFQEDEGTRVFIAQIATAGLGITLTAASLSVFYSFGWNYADYQQATARTHRIGQTNKCTYINLIIKKSIDERVMRAIEHKETNAKSIVDNWREFIQ